MRNWLRGVIVLFFVQVMFVLPALSLDLDSTVTDSERANYSKSNSQTSQPAQTTQTVKETKPETAATQSQPTIRHDLPTVPKLPSNATSSTVAPINTEYSGKMPNSDALIPCTDIKVSGLKVDNKVAKSKTQTKQKVKTPNYQTAVLPSGTQIRVINRNKITDYISEGQGVVFLSTQEIKTPYLTIPKNTQFTAKVMDSHRPQMTCNGGLVGLRFVSANINGYNQTIDGGVIRLKTDRIYFSNLKGEHTYKKNVVKKAKWGQNKFKEYAKTSHQLANKGAGVIIAPFPYLGGCVLAGASTISSPVTALLGKGGNLNIPAKTVFTMKIYDDAKIRLK